MAFNSIPFFVTEYELYNQDHENFIDCKQYVDELHKPEEQLQKVCRFDITDLGNCQKQDTYGYEDGRPCVLLKINKVTIDTIDLSVNTLSNKMSNLHFMYIFMYSYIHVYM